MWDSDSKQKAINELVEKHDIDLSKSYAYGDTSGDYTMFKSVGCPFAINPTKELLGKIKNDESLKDKINLIVERKDVIYNLDIEDFCIHNRSKNHRCHFLYLECILFQFLKN